MLENERQWLLSLSAVSLMGPKWDVDRLKKRGYYKKPSQNKKPLDSSLEINDGMDQAHQHTLEGYLLILGVDCREAYYKALDGFLIGSQFSKDMARLMQVGKSMGKIERDKKQSFLINGHIYLFDCFQMLMAYEFHWPKKGLQAYDLANGLMLLRVGKGLGYIDEDGLDDYMIRFFEQAQVLFQDAKSFGEAAEIGRELHCKYLNSIGSKHDITNEKNVLSIAYYSLWKNMTHVWPGEKVI